MQIQLLNTTATCQQPPVAVAATKAFEPSKVVLAVVASVLAVAMLLGLGLVST